MNDEDKKHVARAGGSVVDETRWNGGLEPTTLGRVFGGYGGVEVERNRKRLQKVKKAVDYWMDRDFERRVEESRMALQLKTRKRDRSGSNGGGGGGGSAHPTADDGDGAAGERDWSDLGTNEHEQLVTQRQRMEEASPKMLVSEKWSLDRALFLHGSNEELPARYTSYNPMAGEPPRDLPQEREVLLKRMDLPQRKASSELYKNYTLIQASLRRLKLQDRVGLLAELMDVLCKYANVKGAFTVKGVSTKIPTLNSSSSSSSSSSRDKRGKGSRSIEEHRNYNKVRQMGALGAAFMYLICKKNGLGRNLAEICSSFQYEDVVATGNKHTKFNAKQSALQSGEAFIKAKHCSKALAEIRTLMPEYVQSVTVAAGNPASAASSTIHHAAVKMENPSAHSITSTPASMASTKHSTTHAITATSNLVEHSTSKLQLSPVAVAAITNLMIYARENIQGVKRPAVLLAAITLLVCEAGSKMQTLANQATVVKKEDVKVKVETSSSPSSSSSLGGKRKHIRPSGNRNQKQSLKRRRLDHGKNHLSTSPSPSPSISSSASTSTSTSLDDETPTSVTPEPEPFDVLSHPIQETNISSPLPAWSEWKREKPWGRSIQDIENSCGVTLSAVKDCYLKQIYPRRKVLLEFLQSSFPQNTTIHGCQVDVMIGNIAAAAPLLMTKLK